MIWKSSIVLLVRTSTSRLLNNFSGCPNSTIDTFLNGFTPGQLSQKSSNKCITSSISINNSVIRQSDYLQKIKNKTLLFDVFPWNQFHNSLLDSCFREINFIYTIWFFFFVKSNPPAYRMLGGLAIFNDYDWIFALGYDHNSGSRKRGFTR